MNDLKLSSLLKGLATFVPGTNRLACSGSGGTTSARYCYAVWLRMLVKLHDHGIRLNLSHTAELGPGDSIGIGLCAMLSGADHYYALDAKKHALSLRNCSILEELILLFKNRTPIPDEIEFPKVSPTLKSYVFPDWILSDERLGRTLAEDRLKKLRARVSQKSTNSEDLSIHYTAPWDDPTVIASEAIDFLFSQAVMEHVDQIEKAYTCMNVWLKADGITAHTIDFKSHGLTRHWYGHWTVSAGVWKIVRGRRPYLINRLPLSAHLRLFTQHGFNILLCEKRPVEAMKSSVAAKEFRNFEPEDYETSGCFLAAQKRP